MASAYFSSVPTLDYSQTLSPSSKPQFIKELQHALINVGFLYLSNVPVKPDELVAYIPQLFALPQDAKDKISMANSKHFLGYNKLGAEFTKGRKDWREQFDIATPACDPDYWNLWGPSQWPDEELLPGFKTVMERYLLDVQKLSYEFIGLLAEAFGLPATALAQFYDRDEFMQHRGKIVQYPQTDGTAESQGVGPHYDAGFLTFLLQASDHKGLQVQNLAGDWIDVPPIPGTFVVNIGRALEFATQGLARATSHRVLSPSGGSGPRYSVPFFQNIGLDVKLTEHVLEFPPEVLKLRDARGTLNATDSVNFTEFDREPSGRVNLIGRVKSHPDVAERHYPELFKQVFPNGVPSQVSAY
ncbi:hypothetical protein C8F04DRAFT_1149041 [Mycena alexandri]|uniref:Fe2OG dioxygenase domain-containing protein n=1 Tax=Mycena alexandri TaxID=1745969 RepID=A0AAD6S197_9AGAR|nr:hypothetical protein C8F04DRAFT_1149041 [Mycena alexandri]